MKDYTLKRIYHKDNVEVEDKYQKPYKLLCSGNADGLSDSVCEHLKNGYKLYGNPFVSSHAFCQVVILIEKSDCNTGPR